MPSLGIGVHPEDRLDAATLLSHGEPALYRAKEDGGNRLGGFSTTLNQLCGGRALVASGFKPNGLELELSEMLAELTWNQGSRHSDTRKGF